MELGGTSFPRLPRGRPQASRRCCSAPRRRYCFCRLVLRKRLHHARLRSVGQQPAVLSRKVQPEGPTTSCASRFASQSSSFTLYASDFSLGRLCTPLPDLYNGLDAAGNRLVT